MSTSSRTVARRACAFVVAAVVAASPVWAAPAAHAQGSNWWYETYGVAAAHAEGWTGEGVKVAVIDRFINPALPVFEGQNLEVAERPLCADTSTVVSDAAIDTAIHGTTVTAMINGNGTGAGSISGIAPDADVTFYGMGQEGACYSDDDSYWGRDTFSVGLQRAIDDGAQIVTTSLATSADMSEQDIGAVANAVAKGVIVVVSTPNVQPGTHGYVDFPWTLNGVVSVSALDTEGNLQVDTSTGAPVAPAGVTVAAAGVDLATIGREGNWDDSRLTTGSSLATPLVAGMLAVAAQRYPDATGNQLIQSLVHNTAGGNEALEFAEADGYGYGAAWLSSLLAADPSQYPDENPLMDKPYGLPSQDDVVAAAERDFAPLPDPTIDDFAEGEEEEPAGAVDDESTSPMDGALPAILIAGGIGLVVILGAVVTVVLLTVRRNKIRQGDTP